MLQVGTVALEHQHAKNLVIDVALDERGGARQHLVEVERSIHLFADLGQCCQNFGGSFRASLFGGCTYFCVLGIHRMHHYSRRGESATLSERFYFKKWL